ncbi:MAG: hypothetical protein MJ211_16220 [Bacteroidales bacterium]|nr:hypothetical protein [Bacteroidales bacterium]
MINKITEDISLYLPQYLSANEKDSLKKELGEFSKNGTQKNIYTNALDKANYLLQGDGICNVQYCNFPNTEIRQIPVLLLSNTCDMSLDNKRINPCRVSFAPLINLEKYQNQLLISLKDKDRVESHINDIKKQHITQILYLPKGGKLEYEALVFFDMAISLPLNDELVKNMCENKLFTLSDFGFYLFLLKLSVHFTRVKEKIGRNTGVDYGAND